MLKTCPRSRRWPPKYKGTPIDVLINNAGVLGDMPKQALGSLDKKEFDEVMDVNVFGALATADAFLDHVAASAQKKIVSLTSRSGIISQPGRRGPSYYRASKVALNMVMKVLADDVRDRGVIVALVSPPPTDTDMLKAADRSRKRSLSGEGARCDWRAHQGHRWADHGEQRRAAHLFRWNSAAVVSGAGRYCCIHCP